MENRCKSSRPTLECRTQSHVRTRCTWTSKSLLLEPLSPQRGSGCCGSSWRVTQCASEGDAAETSSWGGRPQPRLLSQRVGRLYIAREGRCRLPDSLFLLFSWQLRPLLRFLSTMAFFLVCSSHIFRTLFVHFFGHYFQREAYLFRRISDCCCCRLTNSTVFFLSKIHRFPIFSPTHHRPAQAISHHHPLFIYRR